MIEIPTDAAAAYEHWFAVNGMRHHIRATRDATENIWTVVHTEFPVGQEPAIKHTSAALGAEAVSEAVTNLMKLVGYIVDTEASHGS